MGINANQLRQLVIAPTLHFLQRHSATAEDLLLALAAGQSALGCRLAEHGTYGIFQISAEQHQCCWDHYLANDPCLASQVRGLASQHAFLEDPHLELAVNLRYATAIAWFLLEAQHIKLPASTDIRRFAQIWQQAFAPQGRPGDFIQAWHNCLDGTLQAA